MEGWGWWSFEIWIKKLIKTPQTTSFHPIFQCCMFTPCPWNQKKKQNSIFFFLLWLPWIACLLFAFFSYFFSICFFGNAWARQEFERLAHWIIAFTLDKTPTPRARVPCSQHERAKNLPVPFPPQFPQTGWGKVSWMHKIPSKFKSSQNYLFLEEKIHHFLMLFLHY